MQTVSIFEKCCIKREFISFIIDNMTTASDKTSTFGTTNGKWLKQNFMDVREATPDVLYLHSKSFKSKKHIKNKQHFQRKTKTNYLL